MNLLREYIRETLLKEHRRIISENFMKKAWELYKDFDKAVSSGVSADHLVGPYLEKLDAWMEKNADKIPFYATGEEFKELRKAHGHTMEAAEERREEWKKANPGKEPVWEKTFLGIKASNWLPELFPDPGKPNQ